MTKTRVKLKDYVRHTRIPTSTTSSTRQRAPYVSVARRPRVEGVTYGTALALILFTFFVCLSGGILFVQGLLTVLGKG